MYDLNVGDIGMLIPGETLFMDWSEEPWNIDFTDLYIKEVIYDALEDSNDSVILYNKVYFKADTNQIDDNAQLIEQIASDYIPADASGKTLSITLKDNEASALDIKEGSNSYLKFITTNSGEKIQLGKDLDLPAARSFTMLDNNAAALDIKEGSNSYLKFITTNRLEKITVGKPITTVNTGYFESTAAGSIFKDTADGSRPTGYNERASYEPTTGAVAASYDGHTKVLKVEHTTNSDYGLLAFPLSTSVDTAVTVEAWIFHATGTGNFTRFAMLPTDYSVEGFGIQLQSDNRLQITNSSAVYANIDTFVSAGWNHYKIVYNSNATSYVYLNGILVYSGTGWNNSTPKDLLIELGSYKATTATSTSYFDAISLDYETGYVTFMGIADGQNNARAFINTIQAAPIKPIHFRNYGYGGTSWDAVGSSAGWNDIDLSAFVPSWANYVLVWGTSQGGTSMSAYTEISSGGNTTDDRNYLLWYSPAYWEGWVKLSATKTISYKFFNSATSVYFKVKGWSA